MQNISENKELFKNNTKILLKNLEVFKELKTIEKIPNFLEKSDELLPSLLSLLKYNFFDENLSKFEIENLKILQKNFLAILNGLTSIFNEEFNKNNIKVFENYLQIIKESINEIKNISKTFSPGLLQMEKNVNILEMNLNSSSFDQIRENELERDPGISERLKKVIYFLLGLIVIAVVIFLIFYLKKKNELKIVLKLLIKKTNLKVNF